MSNRKSKPNTPDSGNNLEVLIKGEMTIQKIAEIREAICEAFSTSGSVTLDLRGITDLDVTGLQMICSAHISSYARGKGFSVIFPEEESIKNIVLDVGFLRHTGCVLDVDHTCIWTGGNERWAK
jgi:anti-anti-sigma regulatory factor